MSRNDAPPLERPELAAEEGTPNWAGWEAAAAEDIPNWAESRPAGQQAEVE